MSTTFSYQVLIILLLHLIKFGAQTSINITQRLHIICNFQSRKAFLFYIIFYTDYAKYYKNKAITNTLVL